jgi:hypothetical protein
MSYLLMIFIVMDYGIQFGFFILNLEQYRLIITSVFLVMLVVNPFYYNWLIYFIIITND